LQNFSKLTGTFNIYKIFNTDIFLYLICCIIRTEFSLELSRTLTGGTTIQREVTEEVVRLTSRVSINQRKRFASIFHFFTKRRRKKIL